MSAPLESPATPPLPSRDLEELLTPDMYPSVEHLITEDDTPVDNIYSERQMHLLTEPLYSSWLGGAARRRFLALANVGMYFALRKPPLVPDVLFSLDVEMPKSVREKEHRCYFFWEYAKEPDIVMEIVSNNEGGELTSKLRQYAEWHVPYYVVWDPSCLLSDKKLQIFCNPSRKKYQLFGGQWFDEAGLGLTVWHGAYEGLEDDWLRWCDAAGEVILTGAERADAAEKLNRRLEEQLRKLGIEPMSGKS